MSRKQRWIVVCLFAAAMAWMEAATVVYLRMLVGRIQPYQPNPLPRCGALEYIEIVRELATLLMLAAAALLAGHNRRTRFAYFMLAFGAWDILYYVFLASTVGWPRSLLDWDVLFLIPLPWWGPVLAPTLIALGMAICGTLMTQKDPEPWPRRGAWIIAALGSLLAVVVFNLDAAVALGRGEAAVRTVLPVFFRWPWFILALLLMSVVLVDLLSQVRATTPRTGSRSASPGASATVRER